MTHEWRKPDRRIGVSLDVDGLTWWYAEKAPSGNVWCDSGHVFGNCHRLRMAVRMYRKGKR